MNSRATQDGGGAGQAQIWRRLARRLLPLTVATALLIGVGFPAGYYVLEVRALGRVAEIFAEDFSGQIDDLLARPGTAGAPADRQPGDRLLVEAFARRRHIVAIRVLDAEGRAIPGWEYGSPRWRRLVPVGSAPIRLADRRLGTVEIAVGPGPLLVATAGLLVFFGGAGLALVVLMSRCPMRDVRGAERRIGELIDSLERSNAALDRRATEQRRLVAAARALTDTLDPAVVGQRIVDSARELVDARLSALYGRDPDTGNLHALAVSGPEEQWADWTTSLPPGYGVVGLAVAEGRAVATPDCLADPRLRLEADMRAPLEHSPHRAALAVPLVVRETVIGVLAVRDATHRAFDDGALALVRALADQAALAVENARLYGEAQQRLGQSEALLEASRAVGSTLDLTETMRRLARELARALGADMVGAYLADPDWAHLRPMAGYRVPKHLIEHFLTRPFPLKGHRVLEEAFTQGRPVFSSDVPGDPRMDPEIIGWLPLRSALFVPMVVEQAPIGGFFVVWWERRRVFTAEALRLGEGIARQGALAVANARLFERTERALRESEALSSVAKSVSSTLDPVEIMRRICREAARLVGAESGVFFTVDLASGQSRPAAGYHIPKAQMEVARPLSSDEIPPAVLEALARREVLFVRDVSTDPRMQPLPVSALPIRSMVALPVHAKGQGFGTLVLSWWNGVRDLSEGEIELLAALAGQGALALENARLFEGSEARRRTAEALAELGRTLSEALDSEVVAQRTAEGVRTLLGAPVSALFRLAPDSGELEIVAHSGDAASHFGTARRFPRGSGLCARVIGERMPMATPDVLAEPLVSFPPDERARIERAGHRAMLAVPLCVKDRVIGALAVADRPGRVFGEDDVLAARAAADQAALALDNARLFSETRAQARALAAKNAELDSFVYSVSHDLKAPLVTIQGMSELAVQDCGPRLDAQGRHLLDRIRLSAQDMEGLVEDLLALSRIGREARAAEPVDLVELVDELLLELAEPIRARAVKVSRGDLATVWAVRTRMEQVLRNLLSNAVKYIGAAASPTIEIGTADRDHAVECWVRDNGIGIDPVYHDKVFEVFQRLKQVEAEGSGVGLAIVKKIVEGAGGRVWVESVPGGGATFRFTWPKGLGEAGHEPA